MKHAIDLALHFVDCEGRPKIKVKICDVRAFKMSSKETYSYNC